MFKEGLSPWAILSEHLAVGFLLPCYMHWSKRLDAVVLLPCALGVGWE